MRLVIANFYSLCFSPLCLLCDESWIGSWCWVDCWPPHPPLPPPPLPPPPPATVALAIPRLEIAAPVVAMGPDANRYPEVPDSSEKVAWHSFIAAPGRSSNAVFAAHYDWVDEFG